MPSQGMFRHSNAWITGSDGFLLSRRQEGMIKEAIMRGKKGKRGGGVSIKCYVFVLHLDCDPQGCSCYLAMSHVAASLWVDSTLDTSCPASHLITLTVCQLLWEINFTTADVWAYASNPQLKYICHLCLSKAKKLPSNIIHKLTFLSDFFFFPGGKTKIP